MLGIGNGVGSEASRERSCCEIGSVNSPVEALVIYNVVNGKLSAIILASKPMVSPASAMILLF